MTEQFEYRLFGLRIRSAIRLPELLPAEGAGKPDVTIHIGAVEPAPDESGLRADNDSLWLMIPGVARYYVEAGREITVDPDRGVPDRNLRLFLLGSAFGALLHQRAMLPLHANAIEIHGRAVAFMGESGSGKSTLAAWFHDRGYRILSDDVCVVAFDDRGVPFAYPGLPRFRLWHQAMESLGRNTAHYERSYAGPWDQLEKFDVPIDHSAVAGSPTPLGAIYVLDRGDELLIKRLSGVEAAETLFANTYRGSYLSMVNGQKDHWESTIALVRGTTVYRAVREWNLAKLDEQCCRLLTHATEVLAAGTDGPS